MNLHLSKRVFYVTGGSRGIGRAIVQLLLAEGAYVATCARDEEALHHVWDGHPEEERQRLLLHQGDVLNKTQLAASVHKAAATFGRLDGVVANAGAGTAGGVLDTPPAVWSEQCTMKLMSVLNLVQAAQSWLRQSDAGKIVIMNGITARTPEPDMAAVSAARAAVLNMSSSLARTLAPADICVNVVNLGAILTERQRERHRNAASPVPFDQWCQQEAQRRGILLGRMGQPEEVAPLVAFLLSPLNSYMTGAAIDLCGGRVGSI